MQVRTIFSERERTLSNLGSPERVLYSPKFDDDGVMDLVETGKENLYDFIQSHKDSVDIHVILDRFQRGDVAALSKYQGSYGDFTTVPKTYAEALNAMISAEHYFESLPVETRAKFGHSFQQFLASMDKPGFSEQMGFKPPTETPPIDSLTPPSTTERKPIVSPTEPPVESIPSS
uniref:Internal scaffolding protein n=1 Tax=Dulem virus 163 TaxID=3145640 RepID=A0AAU8B2A9_9VIRU